jgi:agmatine deiminase
MTTTLAESRTTILAEWAPQKAIYTAWPADAREWNGDLVAPRRDIAALVRVLRPGNEVRLLVSGAEAEASARAALGGEAEIVRARYSDIWLRDTGPIFAKGAESTVALRFQTNSWGGKFDLPDDAFTGDDIALDSGVPIVRFPFVMEGGAVEQDGVGTVLTTRQTLLNPNRNGWSKRDAEAALEEALGARKVIWIDEGLMNDHTDGHIDNLARFVGPARVVCQAPAGPDDPNAETFDAIARVLEDATDAVGRRLEIIRVPGPGLVRDSLGGIAAASHLNFVIANGVVVVPVYGTHTQEDTLEALQSVFRDRKVIGVPSRGLLGGGDAGGGSFHCITVQVPL